MSVRLSITLDVCLALVIVGGAAHAATKTVDLDGNAANGAESQCDLNVLQTFPVQIENKVTNRTGGDAYTFVWPSAGPGGFTSSLNPGTTGGVGAKWVWTTNQSVFAYTGTSCASDVCFLETAGADPASGTCTLACVDDGVRLSLARGATAAETVLSWPTTSGPFTVYRSSSPRSVGDAANALTTTDLLQYTDVPPAGTAFFYQVRGTGCVTRKSCASNGDCNPATEGICVSRGPFGVPGRSVLASSVTVSSASLTSSLITFFSPPHEVFRASSIAGPGGAAETVANLTPYAMNVTTEEYPPGCCPANPDVPHQMVCNGICVSYLDDPNNCGACGNVCGDGTCCSNGSCASLCGDGQSWCGGQCADLQNDSANCGGCGNVCGDGTCCNAGSCESVCAAGQVWCEGQCVDVKNDSANCGACGTACGDGTCCDHGLCASVCGAGQAWCDGECADVVNDSNNCGACGHACGEGTCCSGGVCASMCGGGRTDCGGLCYDTANDPENCGACGTVCAEDSICTGGACVRCTGQGGARDECDNRCVNLNTDPYNCGACGVSCNENCPSGFKGVCSNGQSCRCVAGTPAPQPPPNIPPPTPLVCPNPDPSPGPVPGVCPNPDPSSPVAGSCPNPDPSSPVPGVCPAPGPSVPSVEEAPTCEVNATTQSVPPGGSATICRQGGVLFKEVTSTIKVCGDGIPGVDGACNNTTTKITTGTFNRLVPDLSRPVGDAYVTPYAVHILADTSNDGLLEPGESASLVIDVVNAGPMNITQASATLSAPEIDLSDDGTANPVGITVGGAAASYGTIPGSPVATDCTAPPPQPTSNATVFPITVPANHPGDTSHPVVLKVAGTVNGAPFAMDVPISLGIADACNPAARTRDYDGVDGLSSPMAKLVPAGDPVPFPSRSFTAGNTRPLKLRVLCGGTNLTDADLDAPEIVALSEATRGALDIRALNLNFDSTTNPNDPFFRFTSTLAGAQWSYNMRTALIGTGSFTLTIRIAGRKNYVTGFVLE